MKNLSSQQPQQSINDELVLILQEYGLTRPAVADMCMCSLSAVDRWLLPAGNPNRHNMPARSLKLLVLEIQSRGLTKKEES